MSESSPSAPAGDVPAVVPGRFADVVEPCGGPGRRLTGEQPEPGTVSGTVVEDRIPALEAVDGVGSVDRERTVRLPPSDSPVR